MDPSTTNIGIGGAILYGVLLILHRLGIPTLPQVQPQPKPEPTPAPTPAPVPAPAPSAHPLLDSVLAYVLSLIAKRDAGQTLTAGEQRELAAFHPIASGVLQSAAPTAKA